MGRSTYRCSGGTAKIIIRRGFHSRFSLGTSKFRTKRPFSHGKRTGRMVALAGNLHFSGSSFLTGLTAVFVAGLYNALAREVCTLGLLIGRDHDFSFLKFQSLET